MLREKETTHILYIDLMTTGGKQTAFYYQTGR